MEQVCLHIVAWDRMMGRESWKRAQRLLEGVRAASPSPAGPGIVAGRMASQVRPGPHEPRSGMGGVGGSMPASSRMASRSGVATESSCQRDREDHSRERPRQPSRMWKSRWLARGRSSWGLMGGGLEKARQMVIGLSENVAGSPARRSRPLGIVRMEYMRLDLARRAARSSG